MAATTNKSGAKVSDPMEFGAYSSGRSKEQNLGSTLGKPAQSMDFLDSDKRWLKDLGVTTATPKDFQNAWSTSTQQYRKEHHKWSGTYGGRIAIRSISRGIFGAAFFTAGQMYSQKAMTGYSPDKMPENVLQFITKCIDKTVGRGIFEVVKKVSSGNVDLAKRAVTFRDTRHYEGYTGKGNFGITTDGVVKGRSVGHEATMITFDFACASFGDYMARYTLGLFDPEAKNKWIKDGHIHLPTALKDVLKNMWTGVTYAAGEDMAVAIPYIYGMRAQRSVINHFSPGFKYDSDRSLNGGSVKIREFDRLGADGKAIKGPDGAVLKEAKVIGNYQLEGMLDLMGRFAWYNVGTKMFRDTYALVADKMQHWWRGDRKVGLPTINPAIFTPGNIVRGAEHSVRYVARTIIKVMSYMLPATVLFFITRTPQSKYLGMAIEPQKGPMGYMGKNGIFEAFQADSFRLHKGTSESVYSNLHFDGDPSNKMPNFFLAKHANGYESRYNPFGSENYAPGVNPPWHDAITNRIGRFCYTSGDLVNEAIMPVGKNLFEPNRINEFSRKYANASLSYTPYFMIKTDIGSNALDTKRMDMGIDRGLNGVGGIAKGLLTFNWDKIKSSGKEGVEGFRETFRSMVGQPFSDPRREHMAQQAMMRDEEKRSNEAYQLFRGRGDHLGNDEANGNGKPAMRSKKYATEDLKTQRPTSFQPRTESWAVQEAMKRFQETTKPQGQAVH